jgi:uncharacterized protein
MIKGQVISGRFGEIFIRQKAGEELELGELLIADTKNSKILLQVYDLLYGSQISQQNLELISGMSLEESSNLEFMEPHLRNYKIALLKNLISIKDTKATSSKSLPDFFSEVREVTKEDLSFLTRPKNPLSLGNLRSGTKDLKFPIYLEGDKVFSHHVLITGTTGKGKSVLMSNLIWDTIDKNYCALLILDPHDEYFGRNKIGLKDHPSKKVVYYTPKQVPTGQRSLKINLENLRPDHFDFVNFTSAQRQALYAYFKKFGKLWIEKLFTEDLANSDVKEFHEMSIVVIRRKLKLLLDLDFDGTDIHCGGIFDKQAGQNTIRDICSELENEHTVIIDTSDFSGQIELLIGSLITTEIFYRYKRYKTKGINDKPVVSIVLEEAPRVIGKEVLERGSNIFSTIAREGRKFGLGLVAITQLPSLIPKEILANINTKIIMGTEMNSERQAIIESASQDMKSDDRAIASLDVGEAIISSNFAKFALPVKIPFFEDTVKLTKKTDNTKTSFEGVKLG